MARARLTRAVHFSATHRYHRPEWSEAENVRRFGPSAREPAHGHTYRCEITVEGEIDPETGMVIDLASLDALLASQVRDRMDRTFLNELADFAGELAIPTTENIARVIWNRLARRLPDHVALRQVRVCEDPDLCSSYRGG